jgi:NAD(P)-dependent dehydrogenase (short-subunit alcohol dehydrogenase family)
MAKSVKDLFSLNGRNAIVTGGSSGIGRAVAEALASAGASTVIVGRNPTTLGAPKAAISAFGGKCEAVSADLSDRRALALSLDRFAELFGEPDILVNAAAVNLRPPLADLSEEEWDLTLAVNLTAPFLLGQRFGPSMAGRGYGRIINFGSQQSFRAFGNSGGYGASKAGVLGLTRSQAEAWSAEGVCCNAVIPGFVWTPMTEAVLSDPGRAAALVQRTMVRREGSVDDFRGVAVFLASPASSYITGQAIFVDGGFSAT